MGTLLNAVALPGIDHHFSLDADSREPKPQVWATQLLPLGIAGVREGRHGAPGP